MLKWLGEWTASEIEVAIPPIARARIDRAWLQSRRMGPDQGDLTIARRCFAHTTASQRDLIAYWQIVKLIEEDRLRPRAGTEAS